MFGYDSARAERDCRLLLRESGRKGSDRTMRSLRRLMGFRMSKMLMLATCRSTEMTSQGRNCRQGPHLPAASTREPTMQDHRHHSAIDVSQQVEPQQERRREGTEDEAQHIQPDAEDPARKLQYSAEDLGAARGELQPRFARKLPGDGSLGRHVPGTWSSTPATSCASSSASSRGRIQEQSTLATVATVFRSPPGFPMLPPGRTLALTVPSPPRPPYSMMLKTAQTCRSARAGPESAKDSASFPRLFRRFLSLSVSFAPSLSRGADRLPTAVPTVSVQWHYYVHSCKHDNKIKDRWFRYPGVLWRSLKRWS
eukprot:scaffold7572_cov248-Pinguiococcus_pyrenoidosus.AAC.2